jgi:NTP pyrophosphatase (non-canonical NTP hydrolase)
MQQLTSLEYEAHVGFDDIMNKVVQEVGEIHDAVLHKDDAEVRGEIRDALVNIISI